MPIHDFTNWCPPETKDLPEKVHPKQFMILKILITALGYMTLLEENVSEKGDGRDHYREGYFRWYGPIGEK